MKKHEHLYELIKEIRPLRNTLINALEIELSSTDLSLPERNVLEILNENKHGTVPEMSELLGLKRQYVLRLVNTLIAKKYVAKIKNVIDNKTISISITPEGIKVISKVLKTEADNLKRVSIFFNNQEISDSLNLLKKLRNCFSDEKIWRGRG